MTACPHSSAPPILLARRGGEISKGRGLIPNYEASATKVYSMELNERIATVGLKFFGICGQLEGGDGKWAPLGARSTGLVREVERRTGSRPRISSYRARNVLTRIETYCTKASMEERGDYFTFSQAAEYLGTSRVTLWRRVRDGDLPTYAAGSSKRVKLVKRRDLDKLREPKRYKKKPNAAPR